MKDKLKKNFGIFSGFFKAVWSKKASRVLLLLSGALLIAAVVVGVCLFDEGVVAASNAKTLMEAYDQAVEEMEPSAQGADPVDTTATAPASAPSPITVDGYQVIGKLVISKIEQELPVIAFTDDKALKVSVCYYQGPMPDETGNLVITGHNFASGAHFGRLSELDIGDSVTMSMTDGNAYHYTVYDKQEIKPDDVEALDEYEGDHILTLMTCTSHGNRRLLVRCSLKGND